MAILFDLKITANAGGIEVHCEKWPRPLCLTPTDARILAETLTKAADILDRRPSLVSILGVLPPPEKG